MKLNGKKLEPASAHSYGENLSTEGNPSIDFANSLQIFAIKVAKFESQQDRPEPAASEACESEWVMDTPVVLSGEIHGSKKKGDRAPSNQSREARPFICTQPPVPAAHDRYA